MAEEVDNQEGFFWDACPWVISTKSSGGSGVGGSEEKPAGGKKLVDSSVGNNHRKMKQPEMGAIGGSTVGGDQQVLETAIGSRTKGNVGDVVPKNEDGMVVSHHNDKGKREIESSEHDLHIRTERERRRKMRNMFHQLHALLPQLPPKADKATIVEEAATYIKMLQQTLQNLQTKKLERLHGLSNTSSELLIQTQTLSLSTRESFLADQVSSMKHFGMVLPDPSSISVTSAICSPTVFQTWNSSNVTLNVCGLDAHFSICSSPKPGLLNAICLVLDKHKLDIISAQISSDQYKSLFLIHAQANAGNQSVETFPYDEVYKQAATEISLWANSIWSY